MKNKDKKKKKRNYDSMRISKEDFPQGSTMLYLEYFERHYI